jgi:uncharacterized membrane protein YtjA (UPF0391 family)
VARSLLKWLHGRFTQQLDKPDATSALTEENPMLQAAAVFFIIAIIAAVFGFGGIAAGATEIAKILFFIFLIVFVVSLIMGLMRR